MSTAIKLRGDTTANWNINNPLLLEREIVVDTTTLRFKIGDGVTLYNSLPYMDASTVTALGLKAPLVNTTGGVNNYAPIASPTFTGIVQMKTANGNSDYFNIDSDDGDILLNNESGKAYSNSVLALSDSSGRIATTAFVKGQNYVTSELNGTNYLMVYGVGTPAENAAELQAAYEAAKKMPRYLGVDPTLTNWYKGQVFFESAVGYWEITSNTAGDMAAAILNSISYPGIINPTTVRTTVVVAPGNYTFGAPFNVDAEGIDIVSLTGNADVLLNGISVGGNNVFLKGINCGTFTFAVADGLNLLKLDTCIGSDYSFGSGGTFLGTATNCIGGNDSFGGGGTFSGTATNCIGGNDSFGGNGTFLGTANNCIGGDNSFGGAGGTFTGTATNCTGGNNSFGGGGGNFTGTATNCTGGNNSFGGGGGGGNFTGTATNCTGGSQSFGYNGIFAATGRAENCKLTAGLWSDIVVTAGGKIINCINADGNLVNNPPIFAPIKNPIGGQNNYATINNSEFTGTMKLNGSAVLIGDLTFLSYPAALQSPATATVGHLYRFVNITAAAVNISSPLSGNINGSSSPYSLPAYNGVTFITDGTNWFTV